MTVAKDNPNTISVFVVLEVDFMGGEGGDKLIAVFSTIEKAKASILAEYPGLSGQFESMPQTRLGGIRLGWFRPRVDASLMLVRYIEEQQVDPKATFGPEEAEEEEQKP